MRTLFQWLLLAFPFLVYGQCDRHAPVIGALESFVQKKDPRLLAAVHHPKYRSWYGGESSSTEEVITGLTETFSSVPDYHCVYEDLICTEDSIVLRWTVTGTLPGEEAPSTFQGISIMRIEEGLIIEEWEVQERVE